MCALADYQYLSWKVKWRLSKKNNENENKNENRILQNEYSHPLSSSFLTPFHLLSPSLFLSFLLFFIFLSLHLSFLLSFLPYFFSTVLFLLSPLPPSPFSLLHSYFLLFFVFYKSFFIKRVWFRKILNYDNILLARSCVKYFQRNERNKTKDKRNKKIE